MSLNASRNYHLKMSLENPHKIAKKMVISMKLPKEMVVSLIWSFCVIRVLGKVPTNCIISVYSQNTLVTATWVAVDEEGKGDGGKGDSDEQRQ
jgi:hypothetical protein